MTIKCVWNELSVTVLTMGPKCKVSKKDAIKTIIKFRVDLELALISKDYKSVLPAYTSDVYKRMSKECGGEWNFGNWYTNIRENRRNIFTEAREQLGIEIDDSVPLIDLNNNSNCDSVDESVSSIEEPNANVKGNESIFQLYLTYEQWQRIKPVKNDCKKKRTIHTLKPHSWTNLIALEFFRQHRLPCAYVFKRAEINVSTRGKHFLKISGRCQDEDCDNDFFAYADKELCDHEEFLITVRTRDTTYDNHKEVKRPINGNYRKDIGKACAAEGCHNVQKAMARQHLKRGDTENPIIPSLDVLHKAKQEYQNEELGLPKKNSTDPVLAIYELQYTNQYAGTIHDIGYNPFFVLYGTPGQRSIYLQYLDLMKDSSFITIDASSSIVLQLKRPHGLKSAHIFLFCVVISFGGKVMSAFQFLTESQENEMIEYALKRWLRLVCRKPNVIVQDYQRGLLTANSNAFNGVPIKKYVDSAFLSITQNNGVAGDYVSTFIRVDVAHLIHLVCRWECLKRHHTHTRLIRDFFIRCVALLVDCQNLADFHEIFGLTCVVALQDYKDPPVNQFARTAKDARKKLEGYISSRNVDINGYLTILEEIEKNDRPVPNIPDEDLEELTTYTMSRIELYINNIVTEATVQNGVGQEINGFQLNKFVTNLQRIGKEFPLWSAVGMPFFAEHGTSSESNFNEIKNRVLKDYPNNIRVDKFVAKHLTDLMGATMLLSSKIIQAQKNKFVPLKLIKKINQEPHQPDDNFNLNGHKPAKFNEDLKNDSDFFSRENWGGKASPPIFYPKTSMTSDDEETSLSHVYI